MIITSNISDQSLKLFASSLLTKRVFFRYRKQLNGIRQITRRRRGAAPRWSDVSPTRGPRPHLQFDGAVVQHLQHVQDVAGVLHHEIELHVELASHQLSRRGGGAGQDQNTKQCAGCGLRGVGHRARSTEHRAAAAGSGKQGTKFWNTTQGARNNQASRTVR